MKETYQAIFEAIAAELDRAYTKHGRDQWGRHEFYAILKEEVDEAWDAIKADLPQEDLEKEVIQIAAMCVRYLDTKDRYRNPNQCPMAPRVREFPKAPCKTPRTDAARLDEHDPAMAIASECAKMELELAEKDIQLNSLKNQLDHAKSDLSNWINLVEKVERERDETIELARQAVAKSFGKAFNQGEVEVQLAYSLARVKRLEDAGDAMAADDSTAAHLVEDWEKAKEAAPPAAPSRTVECGRCKGSGVKMNGVFVGGDCPCCEGRGVREATP